MLGRMWIWIVGALFLLGLGVALLWRSRRLAAVSGLPAGQVIYSDTGGWDRVETPLRSRRYGLVGRPDYLVRSNDAGHDAGVAVIPVEVKSGRRPAYPAPGHILQLATYCLLVEDVYKMRPAYGLLRYDDVTVQIPFTAALRQAVLTAADEIRAARGAAQVPRSHDVAARCRHCGYRAACGDEAL